MEELNQQENKSPVKKAIIPIALLALLFALFHYKDSVLNFFDNKHTDSLAEVTAFKNDVRRKDSKSIDFKNTQQNEKIYQLNKTRRFIMATLYQLGRIQMR